MGDVGEQVSVSSREHGTLLARLRSGYATTTNALMSTTLRLALGLQQAQAAMASMASEVAIARKGRAEVEKVGTCAPRWRSLA